MHSRGHTTRNGLISINNFAKMPQEDKTKDNLTLYSNLSFIFSILVCKDQLSSLFITELYAL